MPHVPLRSVAPGTFAPAYLGSADLPWLRILLEEAGRYAGRPRAELDAKLADPLPFDVPPWKVRLGGRVLLASEGRAPKPKVPPSTVRAAVFGEAARRGSRDAVLARAAAALDLDVAAIDRDLYGDLPSQRPVPAMVAELGAMELAERMNLALVQSVVARTRSLRIRAFGGARDLVRHAKREGLLCTVAPLREPGGFQLDVSGPLALFRKTAVYAHALAGLVPRLSWCNEYALEAVYETERGPRAVLVQTGDPIAASRVPVREDRELEDRFERELSQLAPDWNVVREPDPVAVGETVVFPDFALVSKADPRRQWMLEIVGFWTPGYVAEKLERLRAPGSPRLVVCIDEDRVCGDGDLPPGAKVVRFRRGRIDPNAVLAVMQL